MLGRTIADLHWVHDEDLGAVRQIIEEMRSDRGPRTRILNRNYRKDGSTVHCEWYNSVIYDSDGRLSSVLSQVLDVTARRQAEQSLQESEQRLSGIIDAAMDAVVSVDEQQRICLFNPAAERTFGFTEREILGRPLSRLIPAGIGPDPDRDAPSPGETDEQLRPSSQSRIVRGLHVSGAERSLEGSISRTRVGGRRLLTLMLRDVTERAATEAALRRSREGLAQALEAAGAGHWDLGPRVRTRRLRRAVLRRLGPGSGIGTHR